MQQRQQCLMIKVLSFLTTIQLVSNCADARLSSLPYYTYIPGDPSSRVVISAPHGGYKKEIGCPPRIHGCKLQGQCIYNAQRRAPCPGKVCRTNPKMDTGTKEIAEKLADLLGQKIGSRPHLVIMEVHRSQIDANREVREACMHCEACEKVYKDYHSKIEESLASIKQGIHFDMHGQAHGQNSTEFGYTLPIEVLEAASHNGAEIKSSSSIDFLVNRSGLSLKSLVMGEQSLGTFLDNEGFDGLPSKNRPLPNQNTTYKYYKGGYTTQKYNSENIDVIQVEAPSEVRLSKYGKRDEYTAALAQAIYNFYVAHEYDKL